MILKQKIAGMNRNFLDLNRILRINTAVIIRELLTCKILLRKIRQILILNLAPSIKVVEKRKYTYVAALRSNCFKRIDKMNSSRTDSIFDMIAERGGSLSRSSSRESFYTNPSRIDGENRRNSADIQDEMGSPSPDPAFRTIIERALELMGCLRNNYNHSFGLRSYLTSPEDDFVEYDRPVGKCAEISCSLATYSLALFSLATIGAGLVSISRLSTFLEYPEHKFSVSKLIPVAVFVYSFIFSLDKRPPQLVKLFLDMAEVRAIVTKEVEVKELKYEIKQELGNDDQLTTPLLRPVQKNMRQVRNYEDLNLLEKTKVRKFAGLLRKVINRDGSTDQWFYDSKRAGEPDKWKNMRVYGLYMKTRIPGCDLYLMSEFDINKCNAIKSDSVILTNNDTAYFFLNGKIVMEEDKPQVVQGINRQNIALSQSIEPISFKGSEWKKWRIFKESVQKGGHAQKIERHLHDRDQELIKKIQQEFYREQDDKTLNTIVTASEYSIEKKHLESLHDMIGALTYANKNSYLGPPTGPLTRLMNRNLFRWGVFLFTVGSMVVTVMLSLNLGLITTRFLNRYGRDSIDDIFKANHNAAIIIFISPLTPGLLALWHQLNTIPVFDENYRKAVQFDTLTKGLLRWVSRSSCYDFFRSPRTLDIKRVVDLSMFSLTVGLLIAKPLALDNKLLIYSTISYYAAKLFTVIPSLFRNCLPRRVRTEENKPGNREFFSRSLSQPINSSMQMGAAFSQRSNSSNDFEAKYNGHESKFFTLKPDFDNKYNGNNKTVIKLDNPVTEYSTDFDIESSTFH
jgi:hypothetical protein